MTTYNDALLFEFGKFTFNEKKKYIENNYQD